MNSLPRSPDEPIHGMRRKIELRRWARDTVVVWMEDDFHHFGVTLVHDGGQVRDIRGEMVRYPWSTCPGAAHKLRELIGKPLVSRASDVGRLIEMRVHCTHFFDLAGLAMAHAAHGRDRRLYDVVVLDRDVIAATEKTGLPLKTGEGLAALWCDGQQVLRWHLDDQTIITPEASAGQSLQRGFREHTEAMEEEQAEYATILRRAVMVASGRLVDLLQFETAIELDSPPVCYSYQPERARIALHNHDSLRDYARSPEGMLAFRQRKPAAG
jgi:hypothetical protein